ncbi:MAG: hypothetical protein ACO25B_12530, partial [Chitinophagaceae bacterium]
WTHYFWEFIMLFLAVFCGFLAENFREHQVEKKRATQYIHSFIQDLEIDNKQFEQLIKRFIEKDKNLDTLLQKLRGVNSSTGANGLYKYHRQPFNYPDFIYTDRTIQQLKNSGGMRLIENKAVSDSIIAYDALVKLISLDISEGVKDLRVPCMLLTFKLFDLSCCPDLGTNIPSSDVQFPDPGVLLTYDKTILTEYFNITQELKKQYGYYLGDLKHLKERNNSISHFIKQVYHLD